VDLHYIHDSIGEALGTDHFGLREPFTPHQEDYLVRTRESAIGVVGDGNCLSAGLILMERYRDGGSLGTFWQAGPGRR
jgi:hypothetical protein